MAKAPKKPTGGHDVGYRRPPKAHQFKPGQSGNPRGRPKGRPTSEQIFLREASRLVRARSGDRVVHISKLEALIRKLFQLALEGDLAALRLVLPIIAQSEAREDADAGSGSVAGLQRFIPDDDALRRMLARFDHLRNTKAEGQNG